jgi:UDP-glucose 4-epimerase
VLDSARVLAEQGDDGFEPVHAPERLGEVQHIALDTSRARDELGWQARMGLADGLRVTLDSLR